jgi:hypothetical protein
MFSGQQTNEPVHTGKRVSGLEGNGECHSAKKGGFSLGWDTNNNELNDFQKRKQKNKDVQVKLNYQES